MKEFKLKGLYWIGLRALVLASMVFWIYASVLDGEFLWDDSLLITKNWAVQSESLGGLASIWLEPEGVDYFPITYTALWMEWIAFKNNTFGYHLVNVLLHISSCFLLWILLKNLKVPGAWLSSLLFGVHPVCVESVVWISEIKNTLSLLFFLLTCIFWVKHDESKNNTRSNWYYFFSLGAFACAMLAKPSVVATPFLALLYEWWKRGTISRRVFYKTIPLFLIAFVCGLITLSFQWERAIGNHVLPIGGITSRFAVAGMAVVFYIVKVLWPINMMPIYPQWSIKPLYVWQFLPWLGFLIVASAMWMNRRKWRRHATFAAGFFLLMLSPILGFLNFSFMDISWVSDHFLYVPMIGVIAAASAASLEFFRSRHNKLYLFGLALMGCGVIACTLKSYSYAQHWRSEKALWTYTLSKNDSAWQAHLVLGGINLSQRKVDIALEHLERASELKPENLQVQLAFADTLLSHGNPQKAANVLERIRKIYGPHILVMDSLVTAWVQTGQNSKAIEASEKILTANPANCLVRLQRARALRHSGQIELAKKEYRIVLEIDKDNQEAKKGLAEATSLDE